MIKVHGRDWEQWLTKDQASAPILAVYYVLLLHGLTYPFSKIFSNFVHFCPNFQIICPLSTFLCPFSEKLHPCPYFLEQGMSVPESYILISSSFFLLHIYLVWIKKKICLLKILENNVLSAKCEYDHHLIINKCLSLKDLKRNKRYIFFYDF